MSDVDVMSQGIYQVREEWPEGYRLVIPGPMYSKKNSKQIVRNRSRGGRKGNRAFKVLSSANVRQWEANAVALMQAAWAGRAPIDCPVWVTFVFYAPDRRKRDLSNLYEAPQDAMQDAGIIVDDSQIVAHDGSRLLYDKYNPRTEIIVRPLEVRQ